MRPTPLTKPNRLLRRQRLLRGWTLKQVVDELCKLCEEEEDVPGVTADMVSKWEREERKPSRFYQSKLCVLYGKPADQLGFIETIAIPELSQTNSSHSLLPIPTFIPGSSVGTRTMDALLSTEQAQASEALATTILSQSSQQLATLTMFGWTQQDIINALQIVLQGETAMATMNRRQVLQLGAGMLLLGGINIPIHEHPSVEERTQLTRTMGEGIAAGWMLFHVASPAHVLAISRSQLTLLQQVHADIYASVLPMLYSGVYRLSGAALHFQGKYEEAHKAHEKAYAAALDNADLWNMGQSRSWQAYGWSALGNHAEALRVADAALRLTELQNDTESIRLRARLLAFGAENAALLKDERGTEARLDASKQLLEHLPIPHEEFDHISWLQQAGICALHLQQSDVAAKRLQQALDELPTRWSLRYLSTALPLAKAYTRMRERDQALAIVQKAIPVVKSVQAGTLTQEFQIFIQHDFLKSFPSDKYCQQIVVDAQKQIALG